LGKLGMRCARSGSFGSRLHRSLRMTGGCQKERPLFREADFTFWLLY
jgi:hypothetical protein